MTASAERQRQFRRRQRLGLTVYRIEIGARPIETLIALGWLTDEQSYDPRKVSEVLAKLVTRWDTEWHCRNL